MTPQPTKDRCGNSSDWDAKFTGLSLHIASWSKDTRKKVGAVIVNADKRIVSTGYNGQPQGCDDTVSERHERPLKYLYTEHAERNAVYSASMMGASTKGATMYVTMFPCADCARAIIQSGIERIVSPPADFAHERWGESWKAATVMLGEAGVRVDTFNQTDNRQTPADT